MGQNSLHSPLCEPTRPCVPLKRPCVPSTNSRIVCVASRCVGRHLRVKSVASNEALIETHVAFVLQPQGLVWGPPPLLHSDLTEIIKQSMSLHRKADARLPGKGDSNSHGSRPVHLIITMIKWIWTSMMPIRKSLTMSLLTDPGPPFGSVRRLIDYCITQIKYRCFSRSACARVALETGLTETYFPKKRLGGYLESRRCSKDT